jgi:hypothetical protein
MGEKSIPLALGEINKETLFVLDQAGVVSPDVNPELLE